MMEVNDGFTGVTKFKDLPTGDRRFEAPPEDLMAWVKWKMRKALDDELMVAIMYGEPLGHIRLVVDHPIYGFISSSRKDAHVAMTIGETIWVDECTDWPTGFWRIDRAVLDATVQSLPPRLDLHVSWSIKNATPSPPEWKL